MSRSPPECPDLSRSQRATEKTNPNPQVAWISKKLLQDLKIKAPYPLPRGRRCQRTRWWENHRRKPGLPRSSPRRRSKRPSVACFVSSMEKHLGNDGEICARFMRPCSIPRWLGWKPWWQKVPNGNVWEHKRLQEDVTSTASTQVETTTTTTTTPTATAAAATTTTAAEEKLLTWAFQHFTCSIAWPIDNLISDDCHALLNSTSDTWMKILTCMMCYTWNLMLKNSDDTHCSFKPEDGKLFPKIGAAAMHNELESDFMPIVTAIRLKLIWLCNAALMPTSYFAGQLSCLHFFLAADPDWCPSFVNRPV